ncbi:Thioredoxin-like fold-containing protein [Dioscorea alata]|uniref:Thioredoxin-like fold-containing protein n=1 Tax=Dioscorea alata TaxID=55571 RepID=A0ACB7U9N5_DIOAL|nr:Thioredoxin-like fold-containing protein [Dioscorea alata]
MEKSSATIQSFYPIEDVTTGILELKKKRKCLYDLELPSPKHKFGARSSHSGQGFSVEQNFKVDEGPNNIIIANESEQNEESAKDGDSIIIDEYGSVMILDDDKIIQQSSLKTNQVNQHSPTLSLGSYDNNNFRDTLFSLDSRLTQKEKVDEMADFDSSSAKSIDIDDQQQELEHFKIEGYDNVMLYSNGVTTSNESLPFPGMWMVGQDARLNGRKPTIDQEFEQYFSMLML